MKKVLSIESRFYLPPRISVVEVHPEHFICGSQVNTNPYVDELDNQNQNNGDGEGFDFEF